MCSLLTSLKTSGSARSTLGHFPAFFFFFLQDILNHILNDLEIIMGKVGAALAQKASKKKKKKGENSKKSKQLLHC